MKGYSVSLLAALFSSLAFSNSSAVMAQQQSTSGSPPSSCYSHPAGLDPGYYPWDAPACASARGKWATSSAQSSPAQSQKTLALLPERTLVLTHLMTELNSKTVQQGDYVEFIVDRDIIEKGYIVIRGGTRGSAQVTEAHAAGTSGKAGGLKLTFLFLYSTDYQQIPVDGADIAQEPNRDTLPAAALGVVLFGGWGLFFHNFVHGSDATIPTTTKAYVTILGSHMIAVDRVTDAAPPNSANAPAAPLPGSGPISVR